MAPLSANEITLITQFCLSDNVAFCHEKRRNLQSRSLRNDMIKVLIMRLIEFLSTLRVTKDELRDAAAQTSYERLRLINKRPVRPRLKDHN